MEKHKTVDRQITTLLGSRSEYRVLLIASWGFNVELLHRSCNILTCLKSDLWVIVTNQVLYLVYKRNLAIICFITDNFQQYNFIILHIYSTIYTANIK